MTTPTILGDESLGPVFFWREFEEPYGFMSQWYESAFEHEGTTYPSAEMWMMVQKAKLFGDEVPIRIKALKLRTMVCSQAQGNCGKNARSHGSCRTPSSRKASERLQQEEVG